MPGEATGIAGACAVTPKVTGLLLVAALWEF